MPIFTYEDLYNTQNVADTKSIFCEHDHKGQLTLNREGKEGKIPLFKLFMKLVVDDPSEVTFAEEVFGDYVYWTKLRSTSWFKPYYEEWSDVATEKRKQIAFQAIMNEVKSNGKSSFTAAKYLIEEPWRNGNSVYEKRKIKESIASTATKAYTNSAIQKDLERLKSEGLLS